MSEQKERKLDLKNGAEEYARIRKVGLDRFSAAMEYRLKFQAERDQEARDRARVERERLVALGHSLANDPIPTSKMPIEQLQSWIDQEEILLTNRRAVVDKVRAMLARKAKAQTRLEKHQG